MESLAGSVQSDKLVEDHGMDCSAAGQNGMHSAFRLFEQHLALKRPQKHEGKLAPDSDRMHSRHGRQIASRKASEQACIQKQGSTSEGVSAKRLAALCRMCTALTDRGAETGFRTAAAIALTVSEK